MSYNVDPKEVLKYLNELGYCNVTKEQLKEFIRDLKILIKYDLKSINRENEEKENIKPYSERLEKCIDNYEIEEVTKDINRKNDEKYLTELFRNLHSSSTVSSRAKSLPKTESVVSVQILKPKPTKTTSSGTESTATNLDEKHYPTNNYIDRVSCLSCQSEPIFKVNCQNKSKASLNLKPKVSFIRPRKPLKISKSDPVSLYKSYQKEWKKQKVPGENKHYDLRWVIREKMLGDPDIQPRVSMQSIANKKQSKN